MGVQSRPPRTSPEAYTSSESRDHSYSRVSAIVVTPATSQVYWSFCGVNTIAETNDHVLAV
jgi:hypothetical protein